MKRIEPAQSSDKFDWAMGILSALLMAGIVQDGWAHNHGKVDNSFLTPWHAILYGTMALNGLVLFAVGVTNLNKRKGQPFLDAVRDSIPYGYWSSAIGVVLFILAGVHRVIPLPQRFDPSPGSADDAGQRARCVG